MGRSDAALPKEQQHVKLGVVTEKLAVTISRLLPLALHIAVLAPCPACTTSEDKERAKMDSMRRSFAFHNVATLDLSASCVSGGACSWEPTERVGFVHPTWLTHQCILGCKLESSLQEVLDQRHRHVFKRFFVCSQSSELGAPFRSFPLSNWVSPGSMQTPWRRCSECRSSATPAHEACRRRELYGLQLCWMIFAYVFGR